MSSMPSPPRLMVWHIFMKDFRLLWPLGLSAAVCLMLVSIINHRPPPYVEQHAFMQVAMLLTLGAAICMSLLIVLAVQQDALPGANQDWLVRPIRRADLLLAKLLLVVLLVHVPDVALNTVRGLSYGLPMGASLGAAQLSALKLMLVYSLPLMTLAALSRGVTETILTGLALVIGGVFARTLARTFLSTLSQAAHFSFSADETGASWAWELFTHSFLVLLLAAVLLRQYFRRDTAKSRVLLVGGVLLAALTPGFSWQPASAIQQGLAPNPGAGHSVEIAFDAAPGAPPVGADGATLPLDPQRLIHDAEKAEKTAGPSKNVAALVTKFEKDFVTIVLPLRFSGLPGESMLHADRTELRLVGTDDRALYRARGAIIDVQAPVGGGAPVRLRQSFRIPAKVIRQAADQPLRLEIDYALTLLRSHTLPPLAALDGDQVLPEAGHCATHIDDAGNAVDLNCIAVGQIPPCRSVALELSSRAERNAEVFNCELDYEPAALRVSVEPLDDFTSKLPFHDPAAAVSDPVDQAHLAEAQVVIRIYEAQDHFSRHLTIPQFRLRDWQAAAPAVGDKPQSDSQ